MSVSAESLKGFTPIPEGIYDLRFEGFKFAPSKKGDSINMNPQFKVVSGQYANRMVFGRINSLAPWVMQDFSHACGFALEKKQDGGFGFVGDIDGPSSDIKDCSNWTYRGPMTGRTLKAKVVVSTYNGRPGNDIEYFVCAVPDCNTKYPEIQHSTNLLRKSK